MFQRLSRNTSILLLSNVGTAALAFVLIAIIGRGLGDENLGRYAAIMAWIMPLTLLADFGLNTLITRDVAKDRGLTAVYLKQTLRFRCWCGGSLVLLVWIFASLLAADSAVVNGLRITAFMLLIDSTFGVYTALWRAWEAMLPIMLLNISLLAFQVTGAALAIALDTGLTGVLIVIVLADGLQLMSAWLLWRFRYQSSREVLGASRPAPTLSDTPTLKSLLKQSSPFAVAGVLAAIQLRLVFILLEQFSTAQVMGWFAAASRFIEAAKMPPFALFGALFPLLSSLSQDQQPSLFRRTAFGLGLYAVTAAVVFKLGGDFLIRGVFGDEFQGAVPLLTLLGLSLIPLLLRQHLTTLYYARQQERQVNRLIMIVLPVQLLVGIILIQQSGGRGAAWMMLLTECLLLMLLWQNQPGLRWFFPLIGVLISLLLLTHLNEKYAFDGLYGQDAFAYFDYGVEVKAAVQQGRLPEVIYWGLGFPTLLATGFSLFDASPQTAQYLVMICGALTAGFTFLLGADLTRLLSWSEKQAAIAGTLAAALVLFCGQCLQSSVVIMADSPGLLWATVSAWCLVRYGVSGIRYQVSAPHPYPLPMYGEGIKGWGIGDIAIRFFSPSLWIALAAVTLSLAGMTRWLYFLLVLPWGFFCLASWQFRPRWRDLTIAVFAGGLVLLPQIMVSWRYPEPVVGHAWLEGWSPAHALRRDFVNADGTFHYQTPVGYFYASALWNGFYLHPIFLPVLLWGVLCLLLKARESPLPSLLLLGWMAVIYAFLAGIPYQNSRFALAFFVPCACLAGIGGADLWLRLSPYPMLKVGFITAGLVALPLAFNATYQRGQQAIDQLVNHKNGDLAAVYWVDDQIEDAEAVVYTLDLWLMMQHYAPQLNAQQIYYETPDSLAAKIDPDQPTYLLLNVWAIEHQWVGKAPWIAYHWLKDQFTLQQLGRYGNYHLWRIVRSPA